MAEENHDVAVEDVESGGSEGSEGDSDSFIDDLEVDEASVSGQGDEGLRLEEPLSDKEIEELIAEFLEVESKAAEAQEALEKESLAKVESEVREELAQTLLGNDLETAVADEMATLIEDWKTELDELETESAHLLEQLDGAGIELPSLYKWIESQAPNGCSTEAWKTRIHWVGTQVTGEFTESRADAEKYLQTHRPVRRKHGKLLEDGASGFLQKKLAEEGSKDGVTTDVDWGSVNKLFSEGSTKDSASFGSKHWASVYLASTPQQAAEMGLEFPGVNEVEEIDDIDGSSSDPFVAAAVANEELDLSEEQKKIYRKVKEEDDANVERRLQAHLKQRRHRKRHKRDVEILPNKDNEGLETSHDVDKERICSSASPPPDSTETRGSKRSSESEDLNIDNKRSRSIVIDSDGEDAKGSEVLIVSSSDSSDSDESDAEDAISSTRKRKKKIRRIIDDAELGEETKRKIAIEKERQERMKSLEVQFSAKSKMKYSTIFNGNISEDVSAEVLGDASAGYIVNVMREKGEQPVRIPPSISAKLKAHQIKGVRFMWENIIQSVREVKSGDKGLGCILAHMMGLGKTFQVITFLYTAMRAIDLGLKTALIVTPVNVLHNWRQEFLKWRPSEVKPLKVFMLDDVTREKRLELLTKWRAKGGVFLIGYSTFRILSLGKLAKEKDQHMAKEISHALHNGPDILVCDEAHIIKNTKAEITQALKQVRCQRRIALTGSPLQNNLMEYYCMVDFVREGFLGSSHEFRNRFQNPIENGQHTNSTAEDVKIMNQRSHILYEQLKGFVQRMDMSVVKKDLPPKTVFVIAVKLSPLQNKLYKRFLELHGFANGKVSTEKLKGGFFAGYQTLAQILNHPGILHLRKDNSYVRYEDGVENFLADESSSDENADFIGGKKDDEFLQKDWWSDLIHENNYKELEYSGKMVLLLDILAMCSKVGDKALIFSQSIPMLDLIELYLSRLPRHGKSSKFWKKGKDWFRLDGKTESSERQKLVECFNDPLNKRVKCTLISTKAGSLGINLYAANRVIVVDGSWNPTYDLQAIYRAWRYGQTKPVFAYRLMAHKTIEEKIYKRQVTKEGLSARVVDRQQVHRTMSKEEMLHLFEFGDDESHEGSEQENGANLNVTGLEKLPKHEPHLSHGTCSSDKMMEGLVGKHYPSLIANFHLHETLLQENEEEKLSKEEQDLAWQVYRKSFQWEEVQRVIPAEPAVDQKPATSTATSPAAEMNTVAESKARDKPVQRKCTRISHVLTLRSQGTKSGCTTVCGECAHEISWEGLNREGR